jgi:hypothetical protein
MGKRIGVRSHSASRISIRELSRQLSQKRRARSHQRAIL